MQEYPRSLPADFSGEVRLFPLPHVVVFPGSLNPLRVFESRYREMFENAIDDDRLIAMATLLPGYETDYYSRPPIAPAICIGHVAEHRRNDDGSYDFVLIGLQRAHIEHEITPVRSYRRAAVRLLDGPTSLANQKAQQLGETLAEKLVENIPSFEPVLELLESGKMSLRVLTDVAAHNLELDLELKLELLGEADPVVRARTLIDGLPPSETKRRQLPPFSEN